MWSERNGEMSREMSREISVEMSREMSRELQYNETQYIPASLSPADRHQSLDGHHQDGEDGPREGHLGEAQQDRDHDGQDLEPVVLGVPGTGEHHNVEDDDESVQDTQLAYQTLYRHLQPQL